MTSPELVAAIDALEITGDPPRFLRWRGRLRRLSDADMELRELLEYLVLTAALLRKA
jgi:hypothetical protein